MQLIEIDVKLTFKDKVKSFKSLEMHTCLTINILSPKLTIVPGIKMAESLSRIPTGIL